MLRTGALVTLERWAALLEVTANARLDALIVPTRLADRTAEETDLPINPDDPLEGVGDSILLVSVRCVLPPANLDTLPINHAIVEVGSGHPVALRLAPDAARAFLADLGREVRQIPGITIADEADRCLLHRPWDLIRFRDHTIDLDLALLRSAIEPQPIPAGITVVGERENIIIAESTTVFPGCVLDTTLGPIVLDEGATVRPLTIIQGPAYLGAGSTVLDRCHIKPHTAIGPVCKVNGEIGGTIFQGFANKAHDGHLGDSYIGQWANLGAGTTNSNLLNTYTPIKARLSPEHRYEDTGLTFLGAIIGDHTKTAICTILTTGCIIGTGCMLASSNTVPQSVRPFTWLTNEREQPFRLSKFLEVTTAAMARRSFELSPAELALLEALHKARDA